MQLRKMNAHYENIKTDKGMAIQLTSYSTQVVWYYPESKRIEVGSKFDCSVTTCKQVVTFLREICGVNTHSINDLRNVLNGKSNNVDGCSVSYAA